MVTFPLLGRVAAAGKTIAAFQDDIVKALANGYLVNPQVRVDVDTYKSQSVMVFGAVRLPHKVTMTGQLTLLDALAEAGSPTSDAADDVQIAHARDGAPDLADVQGANGPSMGDDVRHFKISQLHLGRGNVTLQDGDIVYVPLAQRFTIGGQVKNSGSYVWEEGLTVEQAVARAGGLTERGSTRRISAHRLVDGKMKDVDLKMQDKVLAGDVIKVDERFF
jgi:polysaccharide export outer membrane protein